MGKGRRRQKNRDNDRDVYGYEDVMRYSSFLLFPFFFSFSSFLSFKDRNCLIKSPSIFLRSLLLHTLGYIHTHIRIENYTIKYIEGTERWNRKEGDGVGWSRMRSMQEKWIGVRWK